VQGQAKAHLWPAQV
jgi:hypothetical protein